MAKSKYHPDLLILVEGWARDGLIDEQIAHNLGIGVATFYEWQKRYPEFRDALKKNKEVVDREVENALLKSALGFTYTEQVVTNKGDVVEIVRQQMPSVTAQIFWLKNRKPDQFRDKREVEHRTDPEQPLEVSHDVHGRLDGYLDTIAQIVGGLAVDDAGADDSPEPMDPGSADSEASAVPAGSSS